LTTGQSEVSVMDRFLGNELDELVSRAVHQPSLASRFRLDL